MSLGHSPKIVTNGLVFYYDMGNPQKSWKGAPTTNITRNVNLYNVSGSAKIEQNTTDTLSPIGTQDVAKVFRGTTATYQTINESLVLSAGTYTVSWYGKENPANAGKWFVQFNDGSWKNSTFLLSAHPYTGGTQRTTYIKDGWYRFEWTVTTVGGTVSFTFHPYNNNTSAGDDSTTFQYFWGLQMELGSFATPFVAGTRSNTQAIVDLTGQNTVTANNLQYNADGTFEFNGSTSYVDLGQVFRYQGNFSIEAICKFTSLPNNASVCAARHPIVYNHDYGYNLMINASGNAVWQIYNTSSATSTSVSSNSVIGNDYVHLVGIKNGTTITLYVNGVAQTSGTLSSNEVYYTSSPFVIGGYGICGGTRFYSDGKIDKVAVYERALTAAEVQQNFTALRGRYGI